MKRVVKKTIATVLSSAMLFGTMLSGGAAPVFAEVFAPDTEDLAFDVLADTQYDDGVPTAEGALQIAMQELAVTVNGSTVLVIGYGRVAKACAKLFRAVGADVTISARKLSALAEAEGAGYKAELITALAENISGYTIIINTVPAMILDEKLLGVMDKNSLIIDLASRPGGIDHETAAKLNRRVVWALGLPAKAAPMTAGEIIARTVTDILNERGTKNVT